LHSGAEQSRRRAFVLESGQNILLQCKRFRLPFRIIERIHSPPSRTDHRCGSGSNPKEKPSPAEDGVKKRITDFLYVFMNKTPVRTSLSNRQIHRTFTPPLTAGDAKI
jgi:hypothetical protein